MKRPGTRQGPGAGLFILLALFLFGIWSNSFIAIDALLAQPGTRGPFLWHELVAARFIPVFFLCAAYCFGFRLRESRLLLRKHWLRLALMGLFSVEGYNCFLYYGQEHGVSPAIAALVTAFNPLFLMILGWTFFHERLGLRKWLGFLVAFAGLVLVALGKGGGGATYPLLVVLTTMAPLAWAFYSILGKPLHEEASPLLATYLSLVLGGLPLFFSLTPGFLSKVFGSPLQPGMSPGQWGLLAFLAIFCTVVGFAIWNWLLGHLPASTVGFTVFLNPPLATFWSFLFLGRVPPPLQILGGLVLLSGVFWGISGRDGFEDGAAKRPPGVDRIRAKSV